MKNCYFPGCSKDRKCTCDLCIASLNTILDLMPSRSSKPPSKILLSFDQSRIPSTPKSKSDYFPGCRKCVSCTCDLCMESKNATIDLMPSSNIQRTPPSINPISFKQSISPSTPKSTANIKSLDTSLLLNSTAIIDFEQNVDKKKKKRWFLNGLVVKRFFLCLGVVLGLAFGVMEFGNISYRARSIPSQKVFGDGVVKEEDLFITSKLWYPATSVLALLQETSQVADAKIDWNKMVRKTATGITNAREYQMLWRHLAYQDCLLEKIENGAQPLDDDSDLECELEAFPAVSAEASAEAAACVKVLIASGLSSDPHGTNGSIVEGPLNITIPQSHASCTSSVKQGCSSTMRRKNITVPISVQKQQLPNSISCENFDNTGAATGNGANKRKRRPWSEQEDQELAEAVKRYGEGNWATLIKGPYKTDRTAGQLAQRWTVLKKKQGKPTPRPSSQLSEAQLAATRRAMSLALDMPMGDKSFKAGPSSHVASRSTVHPSAPESSLVGSQSRAHVQQDPSPSAAQCPATAAGSSKSRVACKKTPTIKSLSPDSKVKATAVAAGARIATPSDAASLLIAAQSKNAVHIKSGGTSMMKPSIPGNVNQLPSNVHFIRTGLVNKPLSTYASRLGSSQEVLANSVKPEIAAVKSDPDAVIIDLGGSSQVNHGTASNMTSKPDVKTVGMTTDASAGHAARVVGKNDNSEAVSSLLIPEASGNQAVSGSLTGQNQINPSSFPSNGSNEKLDDKQTSFLGTHRDYVSGTVQPNSSSSRDAGIHGHWQGEGNDISPPNGTNNRDDINKDIKGAKKLEPMDITVVK